MRPADLLRQPSEDAETAARSHPDHLKGAGYHHALLLVVRRGDALEALEDDVKKWENSKHEFMAVSVTI